MRCPACGWERCLCTGLGVGLAAAYGISPAQIPASESAEPARVAGKVIGFRGWTLAGYRLGSSNTMLGAHWVIGPNHAECLRERWPVHRTLDLGEPHRAPAPDCQCGLYAWHSVPVWDPRGTLVRGAVTAWGRLQVHCDGFRAEYAEPVVLSYDPQQPYEHVKSAEAIASEMGLPFVPVDELAREAAKHGQPVAEDLRPDRRDPLLGPYSTHFATGGVVTHTHTPLPPRVRRRSRGTLIGAWINGLVGALNLTVAIVNGYWWSLVAAAVSFFVAWRYARSWTRSKS